MIPAPTIIYRRDGITLRGECRCIRRWQHPIQFIALIEGDGQLRLSYHGNSEHSLVLDPYHVRALRHVIEATGD